MRLTNKMGIAYEVEDFSNCYEAVDKLGKLEDIEEAMGVDLITYFHFYFGKPLFLKDSTGKIQKIKKTGWVYHPFRKSFIWFHRGVEEIQLFVKDYGKTWALSKDELNK